MSEQPDGSEPKPDTQAGVFGNLPDARPGTRSPRRGTTAKTAKAKSKAPTKPKASPKAKVPPKPKAKSQGDPPPPPPPEPQRPPSAQQPGGLADVAWAGIAVAAEAATIGVRLASRAIEAVRGNPERD